MKRVWIKNGTIVDQGKRHRGSVIIENDTITEILPVDTIPAVPCDLVINAQGKYILPGIIDSHVHFRDPGLTHKADLHTESCAAVAGGVTSIMDMPNTLPQTTTPEALENKFEAGAEKSLVNYSFYFGATDTNYNLFSHLDTTRVGGIKLFMGSSTGNTLVDRPDSLRKIFENSPLPVAAHCEDQNIIATNTEYYRKQFGDQVPIRFHPRIRTIEACYRSSRLAVKLARETGARLHLLHITTARELELLSYADLEDKKITAEVCIPHLLFSAYDYKKYGSLIKCNPAIKSIPNRDALRRAINSNLVDVIATDHAPHLLSEKEGGALRAMSGMPMIQFSLISMLELASQQVTRIERIVEKMCHAPARLFRIADRGYLKPGYKADVVIVSKDKGWKLTREQVLSKCQWSPLEGTPFHWKVDQTFVNGKLVYDNGNIDHRVRGEALRFNQPGSDHNSGPAYYF